MSSKIFILIMTRKQLLYDPFCKKLHYICYCHCRLTFIRNIYTYIFIDTSLFHLQHLQKKITITEPVSNKNQRTEGMIPRKRIQKRQLLNHVIGSIVLDERCSIVTLPTISQTKNRYLKTKLVAECCHGEKQQNLEKVLVLLLTVDLTPWIKQTSRKRAHLIQSQEKEAYCWVLRNLNLWFNDNHNVKQFVMLNSFANQTICV